MSHDLTVRLQVVHDGYGDDNWFRFVVYGPDDKHHFGKVYSTQDRDAMYELSDEIDSDTLRTRDEVNVITKDCRKKLASFLVQ